MKPSSFSHDASVRAILFLLLASLCAACTPAEAPPLDLTSATVTGTRTYHVQQRMELTNLGEVAPARQNLWVALIRDVPPYQEVRSRSITPSGYTLLTDEYDNQYAEFDLSDHPPGKSASFVSARHMRPSSEV